jgi:HPt (histidine-containing phosphotransfer) domain-containing protein
MVEHTIALTNDFVEVYTFEADPALFSKRPKCISLHGKKPNRKEPCENFLFGKKYDPEGIYNAVTLERPADSSQTLLYDLTELRDYASDGDDTNQKVWEEYSRAVDEIASVYGTKGFEKSKAAILAAHPWILFQDSNPKEAGWTDLLLRYTDSGIDSVVISQRNGDADESSVPPSEEEEEEEEEEGDEEEQEAGPASPPPAPRPTKKRPNAGKSSCIDDFRLKDLYAIAKEAKLVGYSHLTKEKVCAALDAKNKNWRRDYADKALGKKFKPKSDIDDGCPPGTTRDALRKIHAKAGIGGTKNLNKRQLCASLEEHLGDNWFAQYEEMLRNGQLENKKRTNSADRAVSKRHTELSEGCPPGSTRDILRKIHSHAQIGGTRKLNKKELCASLKKELGDTWFDQYEELVREAFGGAAPSATKNNKKKKKKSAPAKTQKGKGKEKEKYYSDSDIEF